MRAPVLILLACALTAAGARAQWQMMDGAMTDGPPFAMVGNPAGDRFEVRRRDDDVLEGVLMLREGFETFAPEGCPTFVVDLSRPVSLAERNGPCVASRQRTRFILGRIEDGELASPRIVYLMNGNQVVFRFALEGLGYRETRFPLRNSRNALTELLGPAVDVGVR